jgi:hypothetical protein
VKIAVALLSLAALTALPGPALAAPTDSDRATARALAREGYEAQQRGQYAVAAERFARAEALVHAPTLLVGLARAEVGLGKLVEAHETYRRVLLEGLAPGAPPAFARALEDARREVEVLAPRLAWIVLAVSGPTSPRVRLDDAEVPVAALDVERACDPGAHRVEAAAEGYASGTQTFTLGEGEHRRVTIDLAPASSSATDPAIALATTTAPAPATSTSAPPISPEPMLPEERPAPPPGRAAAQPVDTPAPRSQATAARTLGIAALGVGAVGLLVGGVTGILAIDKHHSLGDVCPGGSCPPGQSGDLSTYHTLTSISTVATVAGVALGTTGVVLLVTTRPASPSGASAWGAGVGGTFR